MPPTPRFASLTVPAGSGGLLAWVIVQSETKCPDFAASLGRPRASPPSIRSQPGRNRTINGLAVAAASAGRASGKRHLWKAKRPASLSAAGRNASRGDLSTMPRKKSIHFLALVVLSRIDRQMAVSDVNAPGWLQSAEAVWKLNPARPLENFILSLRLRKEVWRCAVAYCALLLGECSRL